MASVIQLFNQTVLKEHLIINKIVPRSLIKVNIHSDVQLIKIIFYDVFL